MAFATTLTAAMAEGDLIANVAAGHTEEGDFLVQIDAELLLVERRGLLLNWQVAREQWGTARASHLSGAAVTLVVPVVQTDAPEAPPVANPAASISLDNLTDPPFAVSQIVAPGATDEGGGVGALGGLTYVQATRPATPAAGETLLQIDATGWSVLIAVED